MKGERSVISVAHLIFVLTVALAGCKRVPLTPPAEAAPEFLFEVVFNGSTSTANEATGAWVHSTDTLQGMVHHSVAYAHEATGEIWELVHHVPLDDVASGLTPGLIPHRPAQTDSWNGTITIPDLWLANGEWSVNDEDVNASVVNWAADDDASLEIQGTVEWLEGDDEVFSQEIQVELEALSGCLPGLVLPAIPAVIIEGYTATIFPPVEDEGVAWAWDIENNDYQTIGNEPIVIYFDDDDDVSMDIKLEPGGSNHPYGEFFVRRRLEWEQDFTENLPEGGLGNLILDRALTDATAWMELRYRDADGQWFSSMLGCDDPDLPNWRFEVQSVQGIESESAYAGFEAVTFSCTLPLREEGSESTEFETASLAGIWPIQPF